MCCSEHNIILGEAHLQWLSNLHRISPRSFGTVSKEVEVILQLLSKLRGIGQNSVFLEVYLDHLEKFRILSCLQEGVSPLRN